MARKILSAAQRTTQQPRKGQPGMLDGLAHDGFVAPYDARTCEGETRLTEAELALAAAEDDPAWVTGHEPTAGSGLLCRSPAMGRVLRLVETADATYIDVRGAAYLRFERR